MSQHDYNLINQNGASFRTDLNLALVANVGMNNGLTAPATTFAFMPWMDTTANLMKRRNSADSAWVTEASFNGTTWIPYRSGTAIGTAAERTIGTGALAQVPDTEDVQNQQGIFLVSTGSAGAYAITMVPAIGAYVQGQRFVFKANHESTAGPTLNVNAKGADNLVNPDGTQLAAGDIKVDQLVEVVRRSGTNDFQVISPIGVGAVTGDLVMFFGSTAPNGWVICQGTIGSATSGGSRRANADTESLFKFIWNNLADAEAPVSTGRGASAQADFDDNETITLPETPGRSPVGAGTGSGLTARTLGILGGEEDHQNTETETASHQHSISVANAMSPGGRVARTTLSQAGTENTNNTGGDAAHNTMHTFFAPNFKIKL